MGKAISLPLREQVVTLKQQGYTLQAISQQLNLSFATVRSIWGRFSQQGQTGLLTHFDRCGSKSPATTDKVFRAARWLREMVLKIRTRNLFNFVSNGKKNESKPKVHYRVQS
jgi:transposase